MKRATLTAVPTSTPASAAGDLTDRLLNRESNQGSQAAGASMPATPKTARPRPRRTEQRPAQPNVPAQEDGDRLAPALQAAQKAVEALRLAAQSAPSRHEVALRFRLDSLAHHVQQVKDYVAAALAR